MSGFDELFERIRREIRRLMREIEEEFEEDRPMWTTDGRLEPLISMERLPDKYVLLIDLPYADLKALSIDLKGRRVIIECRLREEIRFSRWTVTREATFNRYYTEVELPEDIDLAGAYIEKDDRKKIVKIVVPRRRI